MSSDAGFSEKPVGIPAEPASGSVIEITLGPTGGGVFPAVEVPVEVTALTETDATVGALDHQGQVFAGLGLQCNAHNRKPFVFIAHYEHPVAIATDHRLRLRSADPDDGDSARDGGSLRKVCRCRGIERGKRRRGGEELQEMTALHEETNGMNG